MPMTQGIPVWGKDYIYMTIGCLLINFHYILLVSKTPRDKKWHDEQTGIRSKSDTPSSQPIINSWRGTIRPPLILASRRLRVRPRWPEQCWPPTNSTALRWEVRIHIEIANCMALDSLLVNTLNIGLRYNSIGLNRKGYKIIFLFKNALT